MLQLDSQNVEMTYSKRNMSCTLKFTNISQTTYLSYKIKTTNPDIFHINPSRGYLTPLQNRQVQFSTKIQFYQSGIQQFNHKIKFQVEYIVFPTKKKVQQIQQLWIKYKKRNAPTTILKLKLIITENEENNLNLGQDSDQERKAKKSNQTDQLLLRKLQDLKNNQNNLLRERQQNFQIIIAKQAIKKKSNGGKSKHNLGKILLFLISFIIGMLLAKYKLRSIFY